MKFKLEKLLARRKYNRRMPAGTIPVNEQRKRKKERDDG